MKGAIGSGGGQTTYLRRMRWDEPALTILAAPMAKATCQLHPGCAPDEGSGDPMTANHDRYPQRKLGGRREERLPTSWNAPAATLCVGGESKQGERSGGASSPIHPSYYEGGVEMVDSTHKPLLDALPKLPPNGLTSIELFAGGGLMRLGIEHAGIRTVWANDFDKNACRAHEHNFGAGSIVQGDITQIPIESIPDADLVIGGPPCQDFSVAGKGAGVEGERGKLVWRYLEIIEAKRPKAFLFENVKGLTTKKHRPTLDALLAKFEEIGYDVDWRVLNAWDYGVSQKRERVFIVGTRKDLGIKFEWPTPEAYKPVLRDAIGDLPEPGVPLTDVQQAFLDRNPVSVAKNRPVTFDEPSRTIPAVMGKGVPYGLFIPNHEDKPLTEGVYTHARDHRIGYNTSLDAPAVTVRTKGEDVLDIANHGIGDYWTPKSEYTYDQANRVQSMDAPSNTIPAHHNSGQPIHPIAKPRRFTVREALRIMSVPDTYVFPDDMSLSAMYRVVGNGVASRVAYHLGAALSAQLFASTSHRESEVVTWNHTQKNSHSRPTTNPTSA